MRKVGYVVVLVLLLASTSSAQAFHMYFVNVTDEAVWFKFVPGITGWDTELVEPDSHWALQGGIAPNDDMVVIAVKANPEQNAYHYPVTVRANKLFNSSRLPRGLTGVVLLKDNKGDFELLPISGIAAPQCALSEEGPNRLIEKHKERITKALGKKAARYQRFLAAQASPHASGTAPQSATPVINREVQLTYKPGPPGSVQGDQCYINNFGKQTVIVSVRSHPDGGTPTVEEYTLLAGASAPVGYTGWTKKTRYDITAARYK